MSVRLVPVRTESDLAEEYRRSPIADLFRHHGERAPVRSYERPPLVIVTCMDSRISLRLPETFAFVLRTAGANVESVLFNLDFAVAVAGVEGLAIIGHDDCAMTAVGRSREAFESGLVRGQGWTPERAASAYESGVSWFGIESARESVWASAQALRKRYPRLLVAPLFYRVGDGRLEMVEGAEES